MSKKLTAEKLLNKEFNLVNEEEWGVFQEWEANHDVKVNGVKCDYAIVDSANFVFFSEEGEIATINCRDSHKLKLSYTK